MPSRLLKVVTSLEIKKWLEHCPKKGQVFVQGSSRGKAKRDQTARLWQDNPVTILLEPGVQESWGQKANARGKLLKPRVIQVAWEKTLLISSRDILPLVWFNVKCIHFRQKEL